MVCLRSLLAEGELKFLFNLEHHALQVFLGHLSVYQIIIFGMYTVTVYQIMPFNY